MNQGVRVIVAVLAAGALLALAACGGGSDESAGDGERATLTVYSGREEEIVGPLFEQFEQETGIAVEVRYGDSAELAATLAEEGDSSPADVFFAQDAGSLGAVADEGLLAVLPDEVLDRVPDAYRDPDGRWTGTSGRVRVVAYNTDAVSTSDLPASILGFADPAWKGRIGLAPTNASFQAFVSAMRLTLGDEQAREWLEAIQANEPMLYEGNSQVLEALAAGEIDVGFVNHYYLYLLKEDKPDAPVANFYLQKGDPGALVNVAGAGVLESSDASDEANRLVEFLVSDAGQRFYSERAEEAEYPLVAGIPAREGLTPLASLQGPELDLGALGEQLESTLLMLNEVGLTS